MIARAQVIGANRTKRKAKKLSPTPKITSVSIVAVEWTNSLPHATGNRGPGPQRPHRQQPPPQAANFGEAFPLPWYWEKRKRQY
jgi:hypothetical protein